MRYFWRFCGICGWMIFVILLATRFLLLRDVDVFGSLDVELRERLRPQDLVPLQEETPSELDLVMNKRQKLLSSACKINSLWNLTHVPIDKFVLDRIFCSDKHKILFCQTPKAGNTQWKKLLIVLNGKFSSVEEIPEELVHDHTMNGLPRLSSLSQQEIIRRLNTYFKFLVVRDPFERLMSAFEAKFVADLSSEPWYKNKIAPAIRRLYQRRGDTLHVQSTNLRFADFVRYLGDTQGRPDLDQLFGVPVIHWTTYAELCAPCDIRYDVIGHHETLERDAPYILRAAGVEQLVAYPHIPPGITRYNQTKVERYFSGISTADIKRLYARFQGDFHLFGYPTPDFLLQSNGRR